MRRGRMRLTAALTVVAFAAMMAAAGPRSHPWHVWVRDVSCQGSEGTEFGSYHCVWVWSRMPRQYETLTACLAHKAWLDAKNSDVEFMCASRAGTRMIDR
jgi:hypothetical protein